MNTALSVLALLVALAALGLQLRPHRRTDPLGAADADDLPSDTLGLRHEVAALRAEAVTALKNLAVVRYDAFDGTGGQLSWSLAILDDNGDGVLITSIHGRTEARTYAKSIVEFASEQPLSREEAEALAQVRAGS